MPISNVSVHANANANVPSATGLLSMLSEPEPSLRKAALTRLFSIVDTQWHEVAQALPDLEALAEDSEEDIAVRQLAAAVASRVFFYLEEPTQALRLALDSGDGVFDLSGTSNNKAYVECLVGAAVDTYVSKKRRENDGEEETAKDDADAANALPIEKLQGVVQFMFERCYDEGKFEHALGVALEARETDKVREILDRCGDQGDVSKFYQVLQYAYVAATTLVSSKAFRFQIVQVIASRLETLADDPSITTAIKKACAFSLANAHQVLKTAKPVSQIVAKLLDGTDDDTLLGLQLCFDLVESGDQNYINAVADSLKIEIETETGEEKSDVFSARFDQAMRILTGGFSSELAISFLHKNSDSDPLIMENLKQALEQRGAGRNSVLHNCSVLTHSYLNAGTTNDAFLRDNLEWMRKASNW